MSEKEKETKRVVAQKVRFVSQDKRYQRMPYPFTVAVSESSQKFVTGQENILTEDQMRGKDTAPKLTADQRRQLQMGTTPFIIHPDNVYNLQALRTFNISYEQFGDDETTREYLVPRDWAEYNFFLKQMQVAPNKESYQVNKHFFYLEDKEKEAQGELQEVDKQWDAENFVRSEMSSDRYKDIILLMNFEVAGFLMDPRVMTDITIRTQVFKACREHPDVVLKLKGEGNTVLLFVLKLLYHKMIERRHGTDFYAGETFVGSTLESVKNWCTDTKNSQLVTKWGVMIEEKEGKK